MTFKLQAQQELASTEHWSARARAAGCSLPQAVVSAAGKADKPGETPQELWVVPPLLWDPAQRKPWAAPALSPPCNCGAASRSSVAAAAGGRAVSPALTGWQPAQRSKGTGGQDRCSPTAGQTHLCYLGFRVAPKANSYAKQGSFGGWSAAVPGTATLRGQGQQLQQTAQSSLCRLLATCTTFTFMSRWWRSSTMHSQQGLGNWGVERSTAIVKQLRLHPIPCAKQAEAKAPWSSTEDCNQVLSMQCLKWPKTTSEAFSIIQHTASSGLPEATQEHSRAGTRRVSCGSGNENHFPLDMGYLTNACGISRLTLLQGFTVTN